jgi:hypothetical protein
MLPMSKAVSVGTAASISDGGWPRSAANARLSVGDCFAGQERSTICRCGEGAIRHRWPAGPLGMVYGTRLVGNGKGTP